MKLAMRSSLIELQTPGVSVFSATLLALLGFFSYMTAYALSVFIQFTYWEILSVGVICAALLVGLSALFMRASLLNFRLRPLRLNLATLAASLFVTCMLIMLTHSVNSTWAAYVHTFPLLEAELGLGWHLDTAYHVSLIQSILNFGYPSIAQHGHPLTAYHVLSHYVDALILFITQVDPFDSYGLFFHYKIFLFLSSILLAVTAMTHRQGWITYLVSFVLLTPCIVGTWHAIGSHGLWMASLILLLSAPFVFSRLFQDEDLTPRQLLALFSTIVFIGLAKISSGFMSGVLLGGFILVKQPARLSTYIFGLALLVFFYLYGNVFFSRLNGISGSLDLASLGLRDFYEYVTASQIIRGQSKTLSEMPAILACTAILLALGFTRENRKDLYPAVASLLAITALYVITRSNKSLSINDIWYFQYGMLSSLILLTFAAIIHSKSKPAWAAQPGNLAASAHERRHTLAAVACLALLTKYAALPSFSIFDAGPEAIRQKIAYANTSPFASINKKLPADEQLTVLGTHNTKTAALEKLGASRPLKALQRDIATILMEHGLVKNQTALVLSKEYFDNQLKPFGGGPLWARGLLAYAITGTQLLYGVTGMPSGYGYTAHYKPFTAVSDQFLSDHDICEGQNIANAVILHTSKDIATIADCR